MKQNDLLYIISSVFILAVLWIAFNLYHAHTTSTITDIQNAQVVPISPTFQKEVINQLKSRAKVDPLFESSTIAASPSGVTPTPTLRVSPTSPAGSASSSATGGRIR